MPVLVRASCGSIVNVGRTGSLVNVGRTGSLVNVGRTGSRVNVGRAIAVAAALLTASLVGVSTARADGLDRAVALYLDADFGGAEAAVREVLAAPDTRADELARAHALEAVLAALDDDGASAVDEALRRAVALDLEVTLPEGAPRGLGERLEAARAAQRARPLTLTIALEGEGDARAVVAQLSGERAGLVSEAALLCRGADGAERSGARVVLGGGAFDCRAVASTERGQVIREARREVVALEAHGDDTPWIVISVVAGAVLVGGAVALAVVLSSGPEPSLGAPRVLEW
ncbi:MAG: hypothetical protein U0353_06380 [Sandaracinus sp.]